MKILFIILMAALALAQPVAATININGPQVRDMDDVHSLGVIYINRNSASDAATAQQASQASGASLIASAF